MNNIQGTCTAQFQWPTRQDSRIVECHLPVGHPGLHEEAGSELTWESVPLPAAAKVMPVTLMPPDGLNATCYTESLMRTFMHDSINGQHLTPPLLLPTTPMRIAQNRNYAAKLFLEESDADWLLFIDSDMGWSEDAVDQLLAVADAGTAPVVGALCFGMRKEETDERGGWRSVPFPTIFDWKQAPEAERPGFMVRYGYTQNTVTQVAATGSAFLLIHRSALESVRAAVGDAWFDRAKMYPDDELMGEDISFCSRLGQLGIPIFVHTGVTTVHLKPVWAGESFYLDAVELAEYRAKAQVQA